MKKVLLSTLAVASSVAVNSANAYDFNKDVYGHAYGKIGYTFQGYTGVMKDAIDESEDSKKFTHGLNIGGGYDVYYKLNNFINPFAGLELQFRIPLTSKVAKDDRYNYEAKIQEFLKFDARFGAKMSVCKDVAVSPYVLVGLNAMKYKDTLDDYSKTKAGLTTGFGVDTIIKDRYIAGVEYRYGFNKFDDLKIQSHNFAVNFGVQFL